MGEQHCSLHVIPLSVCEPNDLSFCMSVSLSSSSSACSLVYILLRFSTCWIITSTALPMRLSWCSQTQGSIKSSQSHRTPEFGSNIPTTKWWKQKHTRYPTWWIAPNISERLDTLVIDWMRMSRFFWSLWMISMDWLSSSHRGIRAWEDRTVLQRHS